MRTSDQTTRPPSFRATRNLLLLGLLLAAALSAVWLRGRPASVTQLPAAPTSTPAPFIKHNVPPPLAKAAAATRAKAAFGKLPLFFIENRGQVDGAIAYYLPARDKTVYFTPQGLTIAFTQPSTKTGTPPERAPRFQPAAFHAGEPHQQWALKLDFIGANPQVRLRGADQTTTAVSYFKGTPEKWQAGLRTFSTLVYEDLWPGIDLVYSGAGQLLKYSFLVKPGADPSRIKLAYRDASSVRLNRAGELEIVTPLGGFTDERPVSFQQINGQQVAVETAYSLEHKRSAITYGFQVDAYDHSQPLLIDPALLIYASYLGSSRDDYGNSLAVNSTGETYITGTTPARLDVPPGSGQSNFVFPLGDEDVFVAKLNAAGTALVYVTYLGSSRDDIGSGIAVDANGNAYVVGTTFGQDFPGVVGAEARARGFIAKLNPTGTLSYFSQTGFDNTDSHANSVAVDTEGNAYVAGSYLTSSLYWGAFICRRSSDGNSYCNAFTGDDDTYGYGVAVDGTGNGYLVGATYSRNIPIGLGPDPIHNGDQDAFILKFNFNNGLLSFLFGSYLGGTDKDGALAVATDAAGNVYVTGYTASTNFPTTAGLDTTLNGGYDAFVARISADGTSVQYSGYLGGSDDDSGTGIAIDGAGNAHVTGTTWSSDFPVVAALDSSFNGVTDVFVATINAAGNALLYSGFHGGTSEEEGHGLAVDGTGNVYLLGLTLSANAPVQNAFDITHNGATDAFIAKLSGLAPNNTVSGTNVSPPLPPGAPQLTFNNVSTPGTTTVEAIPPQSAGTLPGGFTVSGLSVAYEIATTSSFSGPIVLTFDVPAWVPEGTFNALRILHNENGTLVDRTILAPGTPAPNYTTRKISALVNSLSPFVLAARQTAPSVTFSVTPATPALGQTVTLTATVTNGGAPVTSGTVVFKENTATLAGPLPLNANGQASFSTANLGAGPHQIKVEYSGDGGLFLPSQGDGVVTVGCPSITLTPATLPAAQVAVTYTQTLSALPTGTNYSFAVTSGALPPGLSLSSGGMLSGTPTSGGVYNFVVTVRGFAVCSAMVNYSLSVSAICPSLTIGPASLTSGIVGTNYNQAFTASGAAGPYNFALTAGALPAGLTLNATTGILSGTPTASGTFAFTVTAVGVGGCTGNRSYAMTIACPAITLAPSTLPGVQAGMAYNQLVTASPAGAYTYSVMTGNLPPGLTLNAATGALTGTATALGAYSFTVQTLGAGVCSGTQSYTLAVTCPTVTANPATLPNGSVGTTYSQTLSAAPGGNYSFARVSGTLPVGLTLSSAGLLSGTPTVSGTFTFTVRATGFGTCTGERSYTLVIGAACAPITLPALPNGKVGVSYSGSLAGTTPSGSYSFTVESGALPPGLVIDNLFAVLRGVPTAQGNYTFTLKATRNNGCTGTRAYALTISGSNLAQTRNDFDGDGKSDLVLRRGSDWLLTLSTTGTTETISFGLPDDSPALGDYDSDGRTDLAVYRAAAAMWCWRSSRTGETFEYAFDTGWPGEWLPVAADYDGDGRVDVALWESTTATWRIQRSTDGRLLSEQFGDPGDVPVPADYDGDGRSDLAVFQRATARWHIQQSSDGAELVQHFGSPKDEPLVGDFDGDGRADLGVWRGAETVLYLRTNTAPNVTRIPIEGGWVGDRLLLGDYTGNGKLGIAVWRWLQGKWHVHPQLLRD